MYFYKKSNGKWQIGVFEIPAGKCLTATSKVTGAISIELIGSYQVCNNVLPTEFQDVNGNYYADLAAYEAATSGFFVDAALAAAEQLAVDLEVEVQDRTSGDINLQNQINTVASGYLGAIAYNSSAPTPAKNGWYDFSTGDGSTTHCAWIAGSPIVKIGDRVSVLFTAPSTYAYTYQNINLGGALALKSQLEDSITQTSFNASSLAYNQLVSVNSKTPLSYGTITGYYYSNAGVLVPSALYYSTYKVDCRDVKSIKFLDANGYPITPFAVRLWTSAGVLSSQTGVSIIDVSAYAYIAPVFSVSVDSSATFIYKYTKTNRFEYDIEELKHKSLNNCASGGITLYNGDTSVTDNHIVNAVSYKNGSVIIARSGGDVSIVDRSGLETVLLTISGATDWRGLHIDVNQNVYVSPHSSLGSMSMSERGLYRLTYGENAFVKVISLYNPGSLVGSETELNDDTIWTITEDTNGVLWAGVYAHTVRANPSIYKSIDGGITWSIIKKFATGFHIHCVHFDKWNSRIYALVGEINTVYCSIDGGSTFFDTKMITPTKNTMITSTPYCRILGSDSAYNCEIYITTDDIEYRTAYSGFANTIFGFRTSDITGFIYAFCKIDSSVNSLDYFPPIEAISDNTILNSWLAANHTYKSLWQSYNASTVTKYPLDCIRPQHFSVLVSKNGGFTWEFAYKEPTTSDGAYGFWTGGVMFNGELLLGKYNKIGGVSKFYNPLIITEGKKNYGLNGIDLNGEILSIIN